MRHRRHRSRLNRTTEHRTALMRNLAVALIEHEAIRTTAVKAKQLRQYIERIVTIAKDGVAANDTKGVGLAKRRLAFSYLNDKEAVKKLFGDIAPRFTERAGGYTRVVKAGPRLGDNAEMAFIEFVDRTVAVATPPAPVAEETKPAKPKPRVRRKKTTEAEATAD